VGGQGWAVGRFGTIIHSHDDGQTWTFQTNPATSTLFDVDFSDTLHGLACGTSIILYTYDGGETWHDGTGVEEADKWEAGNGKLEIYPNPFTRSLTVKFQIPSAKCQTNSKSQISVQIFNAAGRFIKQFSRLSAMQYGGIQPFNQIIWDGSDDAGRPAPDGVYFIQLSGCDIPVTAKVILKR